MIVLFETRLPVPSTASKLHFPGDVPSGQAKPTPDLRCFPRKKLYMYSFPGCVLWPQFRTWESFKDRRIINCL
jgi:hypothetical protein